MNLQTMNKQRKFVLIAASLGTIAMFLPFIRISFFGISNSVNGMHDTGILIFLCFVGCAVIALMGDQTQNLGKTIWIVALVASGIAALLMVIKFLQAMDAISLFSIGFYLALAASLGLLFAVYNYRPAGYNIKDGFDSLKHDINDKSKTGNPPDTHNH